MSSFSFLPFYTKLLCIFTYAFLPYSCLLRKMTSVLLGRTFSSVVTLVPSSHILQDPAQPPLISSFPLEPILMPTYRLTPTLKILIAQNFHQCWHSSQAILKFSYISKWYKSSTYLQLFTNHHIPMSLVIRILSLIITTLNCSFLTSLWFGTVKHPLVEEPVLSWGQSRFISNLSEHLYLVFHVTCFLW